MRSSTTFIAAAAALLSFAAATPLEPRYAECKAPQQWHTCGDGWSGCCSVTPCKGPSVASACPDQQTSPSSSQTNPAPAAPAPKEAESDEDWMKFCKADDSDCNWKPEYYHIKNYNETFSSISKKQLWVWHDAEGDKDVKRRSAIVVFRDIPKTAKKCSLSFYKPVKGIFYGVATEGTIVFKPLDTGDKTFEEAVGPNVNWKTTRDIVKTAKKETEASLDVNNWGWVATSYQLNSGTKWDCAGKKEMVLEFTSTGGMEGVATHDQVFKKEADSYAQRAGWVLRYL